MGSAIFSVLLSSVRLQRSRSVISKQQRKKITLHVHERVETSWFVCAHIIRVYRW